MADLPAWATEECVEAVARGMYESAPMRPRPMSDDVRSYWLSEARAALLAAAPFVSEALHECRRDVVEEYRQIIDRNTD